MNLYRRHKALDTDSNPKCIGKHAPGSFSGESEERKKAKKKLIA
jgi:hypothetical protein